MATDPNEPLEPSSFEEQQAPKPLVHPRWILLGTLAMIVGLAMGFIMSSLGK